MQVNRQCRFVVAAGVVLVQIVMISYWSAPRMNIFKQDVILLGDIKIYSYPISPLLILPFPMSKDLIVFSAHFDDRPRGNHRNITVILIGASKRVFELKMITGCGVGIINANQFHVRYVYEDHLMHQWLGKNK